MHYLGYQERAQRLVPLLIRERKAMVDAIIYSLTRDRALGEIIRAQLEERVPMLDYADLSGTDLRKTDLSGGNIREANLSESNLSGANLGGADLSKAVLIGVNLIGASLRG